MPYAVKEVERHLFENTITERTVDSGFGWEEEAEKVAQESEKIFWLTHDSLFSDVEYVIFEHDGGE